VSRCYVTQVPGVPVAVCRVHGRVAPCPDNGKPAITDPVHVFSEPSQEVAVEAARRMTAGSRPVVVHQGPEMDAESHAIGRGAAGCWCGPVVIPAG